MAKTMLVGVSNVARKVKKMYVGVENAARRVKKGYIGIGNLARLFYTMGPEYYGTAAALSVARSGGAAAVANDTYAVYAGGYAYSTGGQSVVDAYNRNLSRSTPTALSTARYYGAGASTGEYAVCAGGSTTSAVSNVVNAYNASLVRSTPTALSAARQHLAGAKVGNYALFAGGHTNIGETSVSAVVNSYSSTLTRGTATALSQARAQLKGNHVGSYALFASGLLSGNSLVADAVVDAFDTVLVRSTPAPLTEAKHRFATANIDEKYAIFAGGSNKKAVNAYNAALVRTVATPLDVSTSGEWEGADLPGYALITFLSSVFVYDNAY